VTRCGNENAEVENAQYKRDHITPWHHGGAPYLSLAKETMVADSYGVGAVIIWTVVDICSDIQHCTIYLHLVLKIGSGGGR